MLKAGDQVYKTGEKHRVGKIITTNFAPRIIVEFVDGGREKILEKDLELVQEPATITAKQFDEAVIAYSVGIAREREDMTERDQIVQLITIIAGGLRERLFPND